MNLKVPGAILPLGCTILSTRAKTVGGLVQPPLGELGLTLSDQGTFTPVGAQGGGFHGTPRENHFSTGILQ